MRAYEIVYILDAGLERSAVDAKLETFHAALDGEVSAVDHWGLRQLAYPIGKRTTAYYAVVHVEADPTSLPELERLLRLDEETVRYLIVANEGQPTSGASVLADPPTVAQDEGGDRGPEAAEGRAPAGAPAGDAPSDDDAQARNARHEAESADGGDAVVRQAAADAQGTPAAARGDASGSEGEQAGESDGAEEAAEAPTPRSGPPEFAGARGRRRRHEGPPIVLLNYKDVTTLSRFLTEQGRILPKRTTKVTARFQRRLGAAIKRARYLALIPYMKDHGA